MAEASTWEFPELLRHVNMYMCTQSCPTLCDPMDCSPPRLLCPWNSPGKNTGVGCHSLLQGIFPTQESNLCLLHRRQILYQLSHQESPILRSEDINININQWRKMCPRGPHSKPAKVGSQEVKTQGRGFLLFYSLLCPQKWGGD